MLMRVGVDRALRDAKRTYSDTETVFVLADVVDVTGGDHGEVSVEHAGDHHDGHGVLAGRCRRHVHEGGAPAAGLLEAPLRADELQRRQARAGAAGAHDHVQGPNRINVINSVIGIDG